MRRRKRSEVSDWADELDAFADALPALLHRHIDPVLAEFTEGLRATMPVRTGTLKGTGHWTSDADTDEYEGSAIFGGPLAPYAPYVIGRWVNGEHEWDEVLPAYEDRFEDAIHAVWDEHWRT